MGFVVLLIVFAFQTVAALRPSTSIRELAAVTPLLLVLYLGVAALIDDGLVLLGVGYQAPAKWAATWATDISGFDIFMLAFLIAASLRAVDPQILQRRRIIQLRGRTTIAIKAEALKRLAMNLFIKDGEDYGYEVLPFAFTAEARPDLSPVLAPDDGVVADVRLDRLRRVAKRCQASAQPRPVITVRLDRAVTEETRLGFVSSRIDGRWRNRLLTAFRIKKNLGSDAQSLLIDAADRLHQEAIEAIDAGRGYSFREVCQTQEEVLLEFPKAWAGLGQPYTSDLASDMFRITPLEAISRHLVEQAVKAISVENVDLALNAVGVPYTVATRAFNFGAYALCEQMLLTLNTLAFKTTRSMANSIAEEVRLATLDHIISYIEYCPLRRIENDDLSVNKRSATIEFLANSIKIFTDMLKTALDNNDGEFFGIAQRRLRHFGEYWLPEHSMHETDPAYSLAWETKATLGKFRLILCAWLVRSLWADPTNQIYLDAVTSLAYFEDVQELFDIANLPYNDPAFNVLSGWIMSERVGDEAGVIDTQTPFFRAVVLLALKIDSTSELRPAQWINDFARYLRDSITSIVAEEDLVVGLNIDDVAIKAEALRINIETAVMRQQEIVENRLMEAPISDVQVELFKATVRSRWRDRRILVHVLEWADVCENYRSEGGALNKIYEDYIRKDLFVEGGSSNLTGVAQRIGATLAAHEDSRFWNLIGRAQVLDVIGNDISRRLLGAITIMREDGYHPNVIFVPTTSWRFSGLALESAEVGRDDVLAAATLGLFQGLRVIRIRNLLGRQTVIADLSKYAKLRQEVQGDEDEGLRIDIHPYDEKEALALVSEDAQLMKSDGVESIPDRTRQLRRMVKVDIFRGASLTINDSRAARTILLTP